MTDMTPLLAVDGAQFGYLGVPFVRDLTMLLGVGDSVCLVGANGAGKTTLLRGLAGVIPSMAGSITLQGRPAPRALHQRARSGVAYLAESRSVLKRLTVRENLTVAAVSEARLLGLFPELKEHLDRQVGVLSGGQQQMLAVGLSLGRSPRVLLADEVTMGLAPMVCDRIFEALQHDRRERGTAVLFVEQKLEAAFRSASRFLVMRQGRIVLSGDTADYVGRHHELVEHYL